MNRADPTDATTLMITTVRPDAVMVHGEGSWLVDDRGRRYLDFVQGWAVNALGHAPAEIARALAEQSARLLTPSPAFHNAPQLALADRLTRAAGLERVFFCSTGAEANEGAIKLARKWGRLHRGGAHRIVTTEGAFHGRTLATMAASGKPGWDDLFPPVVPGFVRVPFGDLEATADAIDDDTVAVMLEPIQGEGGVVVPPAGTLRALRELTRERGVLLILDEVQTGMGRTGELFAHQHEDAQPDILTLGKGLGGGVPLAAMLASEAVSCFDVGDQGGTFAGNPLMCAVGLAVVERLTEPDFLAGVRRRAEHLHTGLAALAKRRGCLELRGQGMLLALRLPRESAREVAAAGLRHGLLINAPRTDTLRFMPALTVSVEEIDEMLRRLDAAFEEAL